MEKKRFIFDLDGTLLNSDFTLEKEYFKEVYGSYASLLSDYISKFLDDYERRFPNYTRSRLSRFLTVKSGVIVTPQIIDGWIRIIGDADHELENHVEDVLKYLKSQGYSLAVLTNWFCDTQKPRLERAGIIDYFDDVITGDYVLKPHEEAYEMARGNYSFSECVFIGDNVSKDYLEPVKYGMDAILYDKFDKHDKGYVKIKSMNEIKNIY